MWRFVATGRPAERAFFLNGTGTLIFEALSQFPERGQQAPHRSHTAPGISSTAAAVAWRRQSSDPFPPHFNLSSRRCSMTTPKVWKVVAFHDHHNLRFQRYSIWRVHRSAWQQAPLPWCCFPWLFWKQDLRPLATIILLARPR